MAEAPAELTDPIDLEAAAVDAINVFCRDVLGPRGLLTSDVNEDVLMMGKYEVARRIAQSVTTADQEMMAKAIRTFVYEVLVAYGYLSSDVFGEPSLQKEFITTAGRVVAMHRSFQARQAENREAFLPLFRGKRLDFYGSSLEEVHRIGSRVRALIRLPDALRVELTMTKVTQVSDCVQTNLHAIEVRPVPVGLGGTHEAKLGVRRFHFLSPEHRSMLVIVVGADAEVTVESAEAAT